MGTWRLIRDGDRNAAMNMAIDETIMAAHLDGRCPPTLRLYGWERPSISFGYFQDLSRGGIDLDYCRESGIELVRRPTGGRAVLHGHDVTFSIVILETELPDDHRSVLGSHAWLMGGIVEGLRALGIDARLGGRDVSSSARSADCFAHAAACDIVAPQMTLTPALSLKGRGCLVLPLRERAGVRVICGARKIAGSAQVRRHGVILEQGSIPFRLPEIEPSRVYGRQTEADCELLPGLGRRSIEDAIVLGFRDSQGIEMIEHPLSPEEIKAAEVLAEAGVSDEHSTLHIR